MESVKLNPGELHFNGERLMAGCGSGSIEIESLQLPGTRRLSGRDFANGYDLNHTLE